MRVNLLRLKKGMIKILLNIKEVCDSVSMSETKIRKMIVENRFPSPIEIDGRTLWRLKDIEHWAEQLSDPVKAKRSGRPRLAIEK